jgi:hypothetical protein
MFGLNNYVLLMSTLEKNIDFNDYHILLIII